MRIEELLVSCVSISEDGYDYRGTFVLSCETGKCDEPSMEIDLATFESDKNLLEQIKAHFDLCEDIAIIKDSIMKRVMINSALSSKDEQGENFNQEPDYSVASSTLDNA